VSKGRKVLVLQHADVETFGSFHEVLRAEEIGVRAIQLYAGEACPRSLEGADGLIVMGGPMGVYEQNAHPFLRDELRLLEDALKRDKPILGVCLGSQLLAAALGREVRKGLRREIGWHWVKLTEIAQSDPLWQGIDRSFNAFHWHGDVFDLPRDSVLLASSQLTSNQAFRCGTKAYGFLFHIETTEQLVAAMVRSFPEEVRDVGASSIEIQVEAARNLPALHRIAQTVFGRWCSLLADEPITNG
jgi:GMP synthase (glutamine-hydrolysing)